MLLNFDPASSALPCWCWLLMTERNFSTSPDSMRQGIGRNFERVFTMVVGVFLTTFREEKFLGEPLGPDEGSSDEWAIIVPRQQHPSDID